MFSASTQLDRTALERVPMEQFLKYFLLADFKWLEESECTYSLFIIHNMVTNEFLTLSILQKAVLALI